jgi:hypothetical protein
VLEYFCLQISRSIFLWPPTQRKKLKFAVNPRTPIKELESIPNIRQQVEILLESHTEDRVNESIPDSE